MSKNVWLSASLVAAAVAVVAGLFLLSRPESPRPQAASPSRGGPVAAPAELLVRPDSHRLSDPGDGKVTLVEFLDFECEACGAAYPGVERLRAEYGDRVSFVLRYFPIPSHRNAELSARAVEAAARQGKLEPMYGLMFENQPSWGERQDPQREVFLGFARDLGLDVALFEADLDSAAVAERVLRDREDGAALGVRGTPTFFLNGVRFPVAPTYENLKAGLDRELAG